MESRSVHPFISSLVGLSLIVELLAVISNSITAGLSYNGTIDKILIISIVTHSVLFVVLIIITSLVFKEVYTGDGIISRSWVNSYCYEFFGTAPTWQIAGLLIGTIIAMFSLNSDLSGFPVGILISGVVIAIYEDNKKVKKALQKILPQHETISLNELKRLIPVSADSKRIRRILLRMILFEGFPAKYDLSTGIVSYGSQVTQKQEITSTVNSGKTWSSWETKPDDTQTLGTTSTVKVPVSTSPLKVKMKSSTGIPKLVCAYCGEEADFDDAKFCAGCGASLSPAK